MATIDYKQKIKDYMNSSEVDTLYKSMLGNLFPELAESEDKRIRKAIINIIGDIDGGFQFEKYGILKKDALTWLEAQGEQKPADKVEPKIKAGDWVVCNNGPHHIFQVIERSWPNAKYRNIDGTEIFLNVNTLDKQYHLWTIQDAKDGDVLASSSGKPFIFKGFFDNDPMAYGGLVADDSFWPASNSNWTTVYCKPATKEQRVLLFQKMKEAGYEWDAKKKELKKIVAPIFHIGDVIVESKPNGYCQPVRVKYVGKESYSCESDDGKRFLSFPIINQDNYELVEQKPAWSEENESVLDALIRRLEGEDVYVSPHLAVECLKSLKDRYTWKPSVAQLNALSIVSKGYVSDDIEAIVSLYNDLKKLKGE